MKHENLVLSKKLIKVELPPSKIWKADVSSISPFSLMKGKRLRHHLSESFMVVIQLLSTHLIKTNFHIVAL